MTLGLKTESHRNPDGKQQQQGLLQRQKKWHVGSEPFPSQFLYSRDVFYSQASCSFHSPSCSSDHDWWQLQHSSLKVIWQSWSAAGIYSFIHLRSAISYFIFSGALTHTKPPAGTGVSFTNHVPGLILHRQLLVQTVGAAVSQNNLHCHRKIKTNLCNFKTVSNTCSPQYVAVTAFIEPVSSLSSIILFYSWLCQFQLCICFFFSLTVLLYVNNSNYTEHV